MRRGWSLIDPALTGAARKLRAVGDDHAEPGRNDVEKFADIFADHMAHATAVADDTARQQLVRTRLTEPY